MMCSDCRVAGSFMNEGDLEEAKRYHERCVDPNCTCQHRTAPHLINLERVNPQAVEGEDKETTDWSLN